MNDIAADTGGSAEKFDIAKLMRRVLLAMLPGVVVATAYLGFGVLFNIALAALFASACEASVLYLRKLPIIFQLRDSSVLITATLLGLALPPYAPWWLIACASASAILLAKQAYGGLGQNIFNPAMFGYVAVLLLFPAQLAHWPAVVATTQMPDAFDGYTMATALDVFKQNNSFTVADWWQRHKQFGAWGGYGWEWINLAFLGGGIYLLWQKVFSWQIPVSILLVLGAMAALGYDNGSSASGGSPLYHWFSGATMLGAFFVATDPATAASTANSRLCYGALIGLLIYAIRTWGHYADGVAFAVLIGNAAAPLLDKSIDPLAAQWRRKFSAAQQNQTGGPTS